MEIAKHLHSQKDFYNLCLVKQFRRVATELLYHTCGSPANLAKLLRTVLQHPDLATRIRDLELTYERNMQAQVTVAVEESELFIRHFKAIGLRPMRQVRWIDALKNVETLSGFIRAALLVHAPNLISMAFYARTIWLGRDFTKPPESVDLDNFWKMMLHPTITALGSLPSPNFHNLRKIFINDKPIHVSRIAPLFYLKSLRELYARDIHEESSPENTSWNPKTFPSGLSGITSLVFDLCNFHPRVLRLLLSACKALEKFRCLDSCPNESWDIGPIGSALQKFRKDLRVLSIYQSQLNERSSEMAMLGSLADFERLELLDINFALFFFSGTGVPEFSNLLPSSIKQIRLFNVRRIPFFEQVVSQDGLVSDFVRNSNTVLPNLNNISVGLVWYDNWEGGDLNDDGSARYEMEPAIEKELEIRGIKFEAYLEEDAFYLVDIRTL